MRATASHLNAQGERVGVLQVLLYRPWSSKDFLAALPANVRRVAVIDRTKEPGTPAEPLCLDVEIFDGGSRSDAARIGGNRHRRWRGESAAKADPVNLSLEEATPLCFTAVSRSLLVRPHLNT